MQLSFRLDKRPGESYLALDGKKSCLASHRLFLRFLHIFGDGGHDPIVSGGNPHGFVWYCLVWLRPRFVLFSLFSSAGETEIWLGDLRVVVSCCFFSVQRLLASARSFNTFNCMLQKSDLTN